MQRIRCAMVNDSSIGEENQVYEAVVRTLSDARLAGKPWYELARIMEPALGALSERSAAAAAIGRAAGIAPAVAKRYVRLLAKMREIAREMQSSDDALFVSSFNSQEIAARIYHRDRVEGADILRRLAKGEVSLPQLREIQAAKPTAPDASLRSKIASTRSASSKTVESALREGGTAIFGETYRTLRRPRLRFIGNTGYEVIAVDGSVLAGVDVLFPDVRLGHDALDRHLGRSLLLAPFFRKFYVAFPSSAEIDDGPATWDGNSSSKGMFDQDMVSRTVELLDWLKFGWIGVLVAVDGNTLKEIRPSAGMPMPDMTSRYEAYVRRYTFAAADNPQKPPPPFALRRSS
jgi:hypothetical protein